MTVAPKKALGQHFLVDENILGVIGRMSDLRPDEVVLEVGPGMGVLTRFLADRVHLVHALEVDRSLEPALRDALGSRTNVSFVWGDALRVDLDALEPAPSKLVANLPYNIATPLVVESLEHAPSLERWCVMVQREVADRLFAEPGTKAYGAVSVLVQLASWASTPCRRQCFAHGLGSSRRSSRSNGRRPCLLARSATWSRQRSRIAARRS